jgi:hypothetical protein
MPSWTGIGTVVAAVALSVLAATPTAANAKLTSLDGFAGYDPQP